MTAVFTNLDAMKKHFNLAEIDLIKSKAEEILTSDVVECYFSVGAHDVCLERDSSSSKIIRIARMETPLWKNEANVQGMNKRAKRAVV